MVEAPQFSATEIKFMGETLNSDEVRAVSLGELLSEVSAELGCEVVMEPDLLKDLVPATAGDRYVPHDKESFTSREKVIKDLSHTLQYIDGQRTLVELPVIETSHATIIGDVESSPMVKVVPKFSQKDGSAIGKRILRVYEMRAVQNRSVNQ